MKQRGLQRLFRTSERELNNSEERKRNVRQGRLKVMGRKER
jgi:hypothetical protein